MTSSRNSGLATQKVSITMLAPSAAGKTCYMAAMSTFMGGSMPSDRGHGLFISSPEPEQRVRLQSIWDQMVTAEGSDRWPSGTTDTVEYRFDLCYNFIPIMAFDWVDYRGGAISDSANADDTRKLSERMKVSDCLFLVISADLLMQDATARLRVEAKSNSINNLLADVGKQFSPTLENAYPVAVVITKADLLDGKVDEKTLVKRVQALYPPLFVKDSAWDIAICPVTLGYDLATDPDTGEIEPEGVHLPVIYAIWHKLFKEGLKVGERQSRQGWLGKILTRFQESRGFGFANSVPLEELEKRFVLLGEELQDVPIFRGGQQLDDYESM